MGPSYRLNRLLRRSVWGWAAVLAAGGVGLKLALLGLNAFPFHADEAVVGLMARHILRGEWPAFFYGQAYMGSLDASLVAAAFGLVGPRVDAIRGIQALVFAGTIFSTVALAREVSPHPGLPIAAGALLAIPTVNVTLYTTVSLGGYGEALLIGNLLLLLALRSSRTPEDFWVAAAWAGMAGLGFWAFGLTLVYSLPSGILLIRAMWRWLGPRRAIGRVAALLGFIAVGAAPWLWSVGSRGPAAFTRELLGSAVAGAGPSEPIAYLASHAFNLIVLGSTVIFGLRPPWEVRWLAWPLLPVAVAFWIAALGLAGSRRGQREVGANPVRWLLSGVAICVLLGFWLTPFGIDPSGRYFLPLAVPLAILGAELVVWLAGQVSSGLALAALAGVLGFNLWGTLESALRNPPGITTQFGPDTRVVAEEVQALVPLLERLGERRGYASYWVAYPLAFLSNEELVFVPRLPYHADLRYTPRDNRYPPYNGMVESSQRVAYITSRHPELDRQIRAGLQRHGIAWREATVGTIRVFYGLSERISPVQLGLGPGGD